MWVHVGGLIVDQYLSWVVRVGIMAAALVEPCGFELALSICLSVCEYSESLLMFIDRPGKESSPPIGWNLYGFHGLAVCVCVCVCVYTLQLFVSVYGWVNPTTWLGKLSPWRPVTIHTCTRVFKQHADTHWYLKNSVGWSSYLHVAQSEPPLVTRCLIWKRDGPGVGGDIYIIIIRYILHDSMINCVAMRLYCSKLLIKLCVDCWQSVVHVTARWSINRRLASYMYVYIVYPGWPFGSHGREELEICEEVTLPV